jgi:hypothetical protein
MARRKHHKNPSARKISETFLDFAEPLLRPLGAEATEADMQQALKIAFTVWNSVVFDTAHRSSHWVGKVRSMLDHDPLGRALVEQLIARKQRLFGDDQRLIGEYRLFRDNGEWRMRVEAKRPSGQSSPTVSRT